MGQSPGGNGIAILLPSDLQVSLFVRLLPFDLSGPLPTPEQEDILCPEVKIVYRNMFQQCSTAST